MKLSPAAQKATKPSLRADEATETNDTSEEMNKSKPEKTAIFSYLQLSNVGCEIIVRGTIKFIERAFPQYAMKFVVPSYHVERDRALLADIENARVIPMLPWKRYLRAGLRQTKRFDKFWSPRFSSTEFKRSDLFVSIGGDIYTIFDGELPDDWMGYETFATSHGIPSIMFGANMEKFEVLPKFKTDRLVSHLSRFKFLAVRDRATDQYLLSHNVTAPIVVYPDPIFSLRPQTTIEHNTVRRIGLNLSPLSVEKFGEGIIERYASIVTSLSRLGYIFDFVPHVYSTDGDIGLDDRVTLQQVLDKVPGNLRHNITLHEDALGLSKVSDVIRHVDLMIAARMHCCLNALTLGKAVFFLGYSAKAKTMLDWIQSETPYELVSGAYKVKSADSVELDDIRGLIASIDERAKSSSATTFISLEEQFASSQAWSFARAITL